MLHPSSEKMPTSPFRGTMRGRVALHFSDAFSQALSNEI